MIRKLQYSVGLEKKKQEHKIKIAVQRSLKLKETKCREVKRDLYFSNIKKIKSNIIEANRQQVLLH